MRSRTTTRTMGICLLWLAVLSSPLHGGSKVVIITPHVDAIRTEFGRAFAEWHLRKYGEKAEADWRQVGGTSDALRFVQSEFAEKPAGIGIDCFWGGGQEPFLVLADKKLSQRYEPPAEILCAIAESLKGVEVYE